MNALFDSLSDKMFEFSLEVTQVVDKQRYVKHLCDDINKFLTRANKYVDSKDVIIQTRCAELLRFHDIMVGEFAKLYFKNDIDSLRGAHDRFFLFFNIKVPMKRLKFVPTYLFNEFIKGITYFKNEQKLCNPAYHRNESCGSKDIQSKAKFAVYASTDKHTKETKKAAIERCYIERLIYNDIYMNTFRRQDIEHMVELETIERLYEDLHGFNHIYIKVFYTKHTYPVKLVIHNVDDKEEYTKVGDVVHCMQYINGNTFSKVQTFDQEAPWQSGGVSK